MPNGEGANLPGSQWRSRLKRDCNGTGADRPGPMLNASQWRSRLKRDCNCEGIAVSKTLLTRVTMALPVKTGLQRP